MNDFENMLLEARMDLSVLDNPPRCIDMVREQLPGSVAEAVAHSARIEGLIAIALKISPDSMGEISKRMLTQHETESFIDLLRTVRDALAVWPTLLDASSWFNSPITAMADKPPALWCDTFEGRGWVRSVLRKIADGEFS